MNGDRESVTSLRVCGNMGGVGFATEEGKDRHSLWDSNESKRPEGRRRTNRPIGSKYPCLSGMISAGVRRSCFLTDFKRLVSDSFESSECARRYTKVYDTSWRFDFSNWSSLCLPLLPCLESQPVLPHRSQFYLRSRIASDVSRSFFVF